MTERLLFIGDAERTEFARLASVLSHVYRLSVARHPAIALRAMRGREQWQLILLAPAYPDEFSRADVAALQAKQPDASLSMVVGSWCEGETRTGRAWPDVPRAYVDQWLAQCANHPSASRERASRITLEAGCDVGGKLIVCAESRSDYEYLAELGQLAGMEVSPALLGSTTNTNDNDHTNDNTNDNTNENTNENSNENSNDQRPRAVLYDAAADPQYRAQRVRGLVMRYPRTPLVTLVNFPRAEEIAELTGLGVAAVLGKPFRIDDLYRYLEASADSMSDVRAA